MKKIIVTVAVMLGLVTGCASHDYGADIMKALGDKPSTTKSQIEIIKITKIEKVEEPLKIGMTRNKVWSILGNPTTKNRTTSVYGESEQWVYRYRDLYIYFENGILTGWQDSY